eukprot:CAMPEP_0113324472 /NCGR_PEP_ID=MMETSP0010_2-20120614/17059_1 /TAXON_ID=216773 ORGANISM="Corethron hystrix, Strain 308" /NCGR_SAMPLE_ID=MMETSP0010_2 /ASSEMBLY_ACC=CAM_ASM_000155 /LENGTH=71 /DNA_ID=CAMNT_0000183845 /DNA_START=30 /DNA_END=245 /DNA_ORIENTATION=+ /assembly_acc=CAM_ASM_000155
MRHPSGEEKVGADGSDAAGSLVSLKRVVQEVLTGERNGSKGNVNYSASDEVIKKAFFGLSRDRPNVSIHEK